LKVKNYFAFWQNLRYNKSMKWDIHQFETLESTNATAFFCPIQHIFWYGKPYEYPVETEIEYFKELPTVWDDYKILEGSPSNYFTIARRSGNRWFVSTHTYSAREVQLDLSFLDNAKSYRAILYTDDAYSTINKTITENLTPSGSLRFSLLKNGGAVAIISEMDGYDNQEFATATEEVVNPNIDPNTYQSQEASVAEIEDSPNETDTQKTAVEISLNTQGKVAALKCYPNPADNFITVDNAEKKILIFDVNGKKLLETRGINGKTEVDVSGLSRGFYIITDGKKSAKFVKR